MTYPDDAWAEERTATVLIFLRDFAIVCVAAVLLVLAAIWFFRWLDKLPDTWDD